jgi:hypothetical protein
MIRMFKKNIVKCIITHITPINNIANEDVIKLIRILKPIIKNIQKVNINDQRKRYNEVLN